MEGLLSKKEQLVSFYAHLPTHCLPPDSITSAPLYLVFNPTLVQKTQILTGVHFLTVR